MIIRDFIQDVVEFLMHATVTLGGPGSPYSGVRDDAGVLIETAIIGSDQNTKTRLVSLQDTPCYHCISAISGWGLHQWHNPILCAVSLGKGANQC